MLHLSTQDVVSSIENSPLVNLDGLIYQEYEDFFGKHHALVIEKNSKFTKLEKQENLSRKVLDKTDPLMRQLTIFFMNAKVTRSLSKKFNIKLQFSSADLWIDNAGFSQPPHIDDERIKLHIQIYLSDDNTGTSLYDNKKNKLHTFKFWPNKGYALLNNDKSLHGLEPVVNDGRRSLYVRYS